MTAAFAQEYEELHRLVDRLPLERARALRTVAVYLVEVDTAQEADPDQVTEAEADSDGRRRRLSFAGIMDAEPDLAARSEEILRQELGQSAT